MSAQLTLGPLFWHWPAEARRDFYFRIADEAPLAAVSLGEVVCAKRAPFFARFLPAVTARLAAAGKQVLLATPAVVAGPGELAAIAAAAADGALVEANDITAIAALDGRRFVAGPLINLFHEGTLDVLTRAGACRFVAPVELPRPAIARLAAHAPDCAAEVTVFGRQPLAIAMRCYHARAYGLHKDNCRFVCERDPAGLAADQLDGRPLLRINGTQTLSAGYLVALREIAGLLADGVTHLRLSPEHGIDMVTLARLVEQVAGGRMDPAEAEAALRALTGPAPWHNGYLHARPGMDWVAA
ncbi:MAG: ubiquinone anaerobic biosynthesis protein UbiV [Acetobacteraceae bacterium]